MKDKKTNLCLLRVISIFMILILHYNLDLGGNLLNNDTGFNKILSIVLEGICIVGVNTFIITTGYFSIESKNNEIKIRKIIDIIAALVFYAVIIALVCLITKIQNINIVFLKTFLKSITDRWFTTTYIILLLLSPFINKLTSNINQKKYKCLLIILLVIFSLWPSFYTDITTKSAGYDIINFSILYLIGGYIKKYCNDLEKKYV